MDSSRQESSAIGRARVLGPIPEPSRSGRTAATVILMSAGLFIAIPLSAVLPTGADFTALTMRGGSLTGFVVLLLCAAVLVAAIASRDATAASIALLVFLFSFTTAASPLVARFVTPTPFTVIYMVMPVAYLAVVLSVPRLRSSLGWFRVGQFTPFLWSALAILAILSVIGLILYFVTIRPDLSHQPVMGSSRMNPAALFAVGIGIALLNAAVEESMYRGILMNALDAALGGGILPIVLQAIAFGTFHFNSTEARHLGRPDNCAPGPGPRMAEMDGTWNAATVYRARSRRHRCLDAGDAPYRLSGRGEIGVRGGDVPGFTKDSLWGHCPIQRRVRELG